MLVACRLAGLSALEGHYAALERARNSGPRAAARLSLTASFRWQRKSEDWQGRASSATSVPLQS